MDTNTIEKENLLPPKPKKEIKPQIKQCIDALLNRFWVLKEENAELYYMIRDYEYELKAFFKEQFRFRMIVTYEMIKLEKIPVTPYEWMGEKEVNGTRTFQKPRDFAFFFRVLEFLEEKGHGQQFSLKDMCEWIETDYPSSEKIVWKSGAGYQNRLALIRVLKYALKMKLLKIVDQQIDEFAGDSNHDVLFEKTPYGRYYMRYFQEDVSNWNDLDDVAAYFKRKQQESVTRKQRYYRRLFLEPVVYHHEIEDDENLYLKQYKDAASSLVERYTDMKYERHQNISMLLKSSYRKAETAHPSDSMLPTIVLSLAGYLWVRRDEFNFTFRQEATLTYEKLNKIITYLKENENGLWTKGYKTKGVASIRDEIIRYLIHWNFAYRDGETSIVVKEGMFRIIGEDR